MAKFHIEDIGAKLLLNTGIDITGATTPRIYYVKPSGDAGYWEASVETQYLTYTTTSVDDFDEVGDWTFQGYCSHAGWTGTTDRAVLKIYNNIT